MASALQQALQWIESGFGLLNNNQPKKQVAKPSVADWSLNALVQNTLDQTAYTPQARTFIQNNVPIDYYNTPKTFSPMFMPAMAAAITIPNETNPNVVIKSQYLNHSPSQSTNSFAVEALRHELAHSMDANVNQSPFANYVGNIGTTLANSYQFNPTVKNNGGYPGLNSFLNSYRVSGSLAPQTADVESFAKIGGQLGQNVMLQNPNVADYYRNIYIPMSKVINYSPVYRITSDPRQLN